LLGGIVDSFETSGKPRRGLPLGEPHIATSREYLHERVRPVRKAQDEAEILHTLRRRFCLSFA
jgi:hypothetical protein